MTTQTLHAGAKGLTQSIGLKYQDGIFVPQEFSLGHDRQRARAARLRLKQLWRKIEELWRDGPKVSGISIEQMRNKRERPVWDGFALEVGEAVAQGKTKFSVAKPTYLNEADYARWLRELAITYPVITFVPDAKRSYKAGAKRLIYIANLLRNQAEAYAQQPSKEELEKLLRLPPDQRPFPVWDSKQRELRCGNIIMKRYRQAPGNQEKLVAAFQANGWARRIQAPSLGDYSYDPKQLSDTVRALNTPQTNRPMVIEFELDGKKNGMIWRWRQ